MSKAEIDRKKAARDAAYAAGPRRPGPARRHSRRRSAGSTSARRRSGLILARNVEVGQVVGPGSGALFRMAEGGADGNAGANVAAGPRLASMSGCRRRVTPIGLDRSFAGSVWQVAPMIDPQSRQGEVRIAVPYDPAIRPGGFAEARISSGTTTAPLLPQSAVLSDDKGNYVYIINGKNEVERRAIKIGAVDDTGVTIAEGLSGKEARRAVGRAVPQPRAEGRAEAPGRALTANGRASAA